MSEVLLLHMCKTKLWQELCGAMNCHFTLARTQNVLGEKGRRIRELTAVVQKRFGFPEGSVEVSGPGGARDCCGLQIAPWGGTSINPHCTEDLVIYSRSVGITSGLVFLLKFSR